MEDVGIQVSDINGHHDGVGRDHMISKKWLIYEGKDFTIYWR